MINPFNYILAYVALVLIRPHEYVQSLANLPILPVILILGFMLWLLRGQKNFEAAQNKVIILFVLFMAFSVAANGWIGGALNVLKDMYPRLIVFYLIASAVDTNRRQQALFLLMVIASTIISIHGIDQSKTGVGWTGAEVVQGGRITYIGILNDPNDLALVLAVTIPMLIFIYRQSNSLFKKMILVSCLLVILYGLYLTNSRGGMLTVLFIGMVYFARRYGVIKAGMAGVIGIAMLMLLPSRLDTISAEESSAHGRVDAWYEGMQMFIYRPIFGVGAGNFTDYHPLAAHNIFVLVIAELGVIGYFLWVAFVGLTLYMMYKLANINIRQFYEDIDVEQLKKWEKSKEMATTLFYSLTAFLTAGFFLSRSYSILLLILCAQCVAQYQMIRKEWPKIPAITFREFSTINISVTLGSIVFLYLVVKILL